jgi:hypothetical protein
MKKLIAAILTLSVVTACGAGAITSAAAQQSDAQISVGLQEPGVRADENISSISYYFSSSGFGAIVYLKRFCSGSIYLELQKKSGSNWYYEDSVSRTFTNEAAPSISKTRSSGGGIYRLQITVTIGGISTVRTSGEFTI